MRRVLMLGAVVAVAMATSVFFGACGSESTDTTSDSASSGQKTLGIVALVATDALGRAVIDGLTQTAEEAGWKVVLNDTQGNVDKANAAMTTFSTTQKVDAICVMAFLPSSLGSGLASAKAANIPVVSWGGEPVNGIIAATSARKVGQQSIDAILDDWGQKGELLELTYHTGVLCLYRQYALDDTLKEHPDIKVTQNEVAIPGQVQDGINYTRAWLAKRPKGSGPLAVWGTWDEPGMGAVAAVKQSGRSDVWVYTVNGGPQALQAVKDGTLRQVVWQDGVAEGKELMSAVLDYQANSEGWSPKVIDVPGVVVSSDNIDQFLAEHPDALNAK